MSREPLGGRASPNPNILLQNQALPEGNATQTNKYKHKQTTQTNKHTRTHTHTTQKKSVFREVFLERERERKKERDGERRRVERARELQTQVHTHIAYSAILSAYVFMYQAICTLHTYACEDLPLPTLSVRNSDGSDNNC